jgi:hypothetical protein
MHMTGKLRGFARKDFDVITKPDPALILSKCKASATDSLLGNQVHLNIYGTPPGTRDQQVLLGSMHYLRYSKDHTPESILCTLSVNEAYVRDKKKDKLIKEFCADAEILTQLIQLHHPRVKEVLFYTPKTPPSDFVKSSLDCLAKEKGTEVKTKICELHEPVFNQQQHRHFTGESKQVALALQLAPVA